MEIDTAARHRAPLLIVVLNNGAWQIEVHDQEQTHGKVVGTRLQYADHAAMARAFGLHAERVERAADLPAALARALAQPARAAGRRRHAGSGVVRRQERPRLGARPAAARGVGRRRAAPARIVIACAVQHRAAACMLIPYGEFAPDLAAPYIAGADRRRAGPHRRRRGARAARVRDRSARTANRCAWARTSTAPNAPPSTSPTASSARRSATTSPSAASASCTHARSATASSSPTRRP